MKKCKRTCYNDEICGREHIDYKEKPALVLYEEPEKAPVVPACPNRKTRIFIQKNGDIFMQ